MPRRLSRRELLRFGSAGVLSALAGCQSLQDVFPDHPASTPAQQSPAGTLSGSVTTAEGTELADATVAALGADSERLAQTETDGDGTFRLDVSRPVWLQVGADGYHERVRAGRPGTPAHISLVEDRNTAALCFGGDVMFGRRFYTEPSDHRIPRFQIDSEDRRAAHDRILQYISPVFRSADLSSINLETPLTTADWRHPQKLYTYTSHPDAARALADAGVDYAALGNNHALDALRPGLTETTATLADAGIEYSGAGRTAENAWEPAVVEIDGLTVALLSCCTRVGAGYDVDWSADRSTGATHTFEQNGETLRMADSVGVAEATGPRLRERVATATESADAVVVQIHGGEPYQRTPTETIRRLTTAAAEAGADLVVNHHPHVVGGIEQIESAVVVWSLGNLVFDQKIFATFPSYLLRAYLSTAGVVEVGVVPVLIDGFVPKGVVGKPAQWITQTVASYSNVGVEWSEQALSYRSTDSPNRRSWRQTVSGEQRIYTRDRGWITAVEDGTVDLGRDLLPTGRFESVLIDETGYTAPLWRFDRNRIGVNPDFGRDGGGLRLRRLGGNDAALIFSNGRRIPVDGSVTVTFLYRTETDRAECLANWFSSTSGGSVRRDRFQLSSPDGNWTRAQFDLDPPVEQAYLTLVVRLPAPDRGERTLDVDDIRCIEWSGADGGQGYDHLRVDGEATVRFAGAQHKKGEWTPLSGQ